MAAVQRKSSERSAPDQDGSAQQNFRFYDNRQKYLMFVNTTSEKRVVAQRVIQELDHIHPRPPAIRVFDAGVGDGTVLTRVMRHMHRRFEHVPFVFVGKEISLEDVRLSLEKLPDRFREHPASVVVMTNLHYAEAPWLTPSKVPPAGVVWKEVALKGRNAGDFEEQIAELDGFLAENWRVTPSAKTGNPLYDKPVVLVIYREDCKFLLEPLMPKPGAPRADYDLVIASQPYRARASADFKVRKVIAPLAKALGPGGRLIGIHSAGDDPALEIIRKVWPDENPFITDRHELLRLTKAELGIKARNYTFHQTSDSRAYFRYDMHTLPGEIDMDAVSIGTSTLFAAWNDAAYVAQIEDQRLAEAMASDTYLQATREVLKRHGGLWFNDECYLISRKFYD